MTDLVEVRRGELVRSVADEIRAESRRIVAAIREDASIDGLRSLADRAEALRLLAKKAGVGLEYQNEAAYGRLSVERELGRRLREDPDFGRGKADTLSALLPDVDKADTRSKIAQRWQKVAALPEPEFESYVSHVREHNEELTSAGVRTEVNRLAGGKGVIQSLTNEWYTPTPYLDAARAVLGGFDLDPASCVEANQIVKAERYLTEDDDGLEHDWHGRVWLNPPYGRLAGDFIERLADQYEAGNVTAAVALVNAHCTDTRWFQRLWDHCLCFTNHRIDFSAGTDTRSGSTHGSVFAYLGQDHAAFAESFAGFGAVVVRYQ